MPTSRDTSFATFDPSTPTVALMREVGWPPFTERQVEGLARDQITGKLRPG